MKGDKLVKSLFEDFAIRLKRSNKIKLLPFSEDEWFRGAYSTIQRTLHHGFAPLSDNDWKNCRNHLFLEIPKLSGENFDDALKKLIILTAQKFKISIGHSQKLISILTKYAVTYYHCSNGQLPDNWKALIDDHLEELPVPLDAIVLFYLKYHYNHEFPDVSARLYLNKNKEHSYSAKIFLNDLSQTWSRLSDFETYWSFQMRIRKLAQIEEISPLEFEMKYLWVRPIEAPSS